jgi:hypothetical protein
MGPQTQNDMTGSLSDGVPVIVRFVLRLILIYFMIGTIHLPLSTHNNDDYALANVESYGFFLPILISDTWHRHQQHVSYCDT